MEPAATAQSTCPNCGRPVAPGAHFCPACGATIEVPEVGTPASTPSSAEPTPPPPPPPVASSAEPAPGQPEPPPPPPNYPAPPVPGGYVGTQPPYGVVPVSGKRVPAGILGILLGGLGIHRFYLGDTVGGILRIVITLFTCGLGSVIGLVEGIIYLTKSDQEFDYEYLVQRKEWF